MWCIILSVLLYMAAPLQSCRGGEGGRDGGGYYDPPRPQQFERNKEEDNYGGGYRDNHDDDGGYDDGYGGRSGGAVIGVPNAWQTDPATEAEWKKWGEDYKNKYDNTNNSSSIPPNIPPPGVVLPEFNVQGPGFSGMEEAPPWADVPVNNGRPSHCFDVPTKYECPAEKNAESSERYYYNPYENECKNSSYTGCGANGNNFKTREDCINECVNSSPLDCSLYYDELNDGVKNNYDMVYP